MKDTAPISTGIMAVAALFGVIAAGVAFVVWDFGFIAAAFIGVLIAVIVAIVLLVGWRKPEPYVQGKAPVAAQPAASASVAPAAPVAAAAAPAATVTATPAAVMAAPAAETPAKAPAAKKAKAAAKPTAAAKPKAAKAEAKPKAAQKPVAADGKPEMLTAARAGGADDLKQIKGVGPKLETLLNTMGIYHFDQVASWRKAEVAWVDENLEGFKGRVSRDDWVKQAKVLAKGGATEFSKKVKKGGVY